MLAQAHKRSEAGFAFSERVELTPGRSSMTDRHLALGHACFHRRSASIINLGGPEPALCMTGDADLEPDGLLDVGFFGERVRPERGRGTSLARSRKGPGSLDRPVSSDPPCRFLVG